MIMEYFMYKNAVENGTENNKKENYYSRNNRNMYYQYDQYDQNEKVVEPMSTPMLIVIFAIYLILGIYAARLSWYSNTKAGWSQGYKVLFAIVAFMFPITYITAHILFKMDLLSRIKGNPKSLY